MTRKRCNRRQRPVMTNPFALMRPASQEARDRVLMRFLSALDSMARGEHPGEAEWRDLSDAINTVETLSLHMGKLVPQEVMPVVNAAIAAMVGAANRFKSGQGMRVDGAGLRALRDVIDIYRQCLEGLTEREMAMAQAETQRRVNALLRAKEQNREVVEL